MKHATSRRPIRALLLANRGEIAVRVARTAAALGIRTIGVYTEPDRGAHHLRAMDLCARVESYLDISGIVAAAIRTGADAVHPGYGFLSETAAFATAVIEAGLTWVGPPPAAIAAMGDKTAARARMSAAGVPIVPGSDGSAQDDAALCAAAEKLGYPVLVKASAGGGGKGMRVVYRPVALPDALAEARRLAVGAFGDGRVFLERYLGQSRHIEVQILADTHGNTTHLGERECSLQRRHQKVIEEAPSPAFAGPGGEAARAALCADAVRAAAAVGYVGAGTVEFLLDEAGQHHFLEMNTRLQVEHPVTEAITGLDLVAWQIRVAEGAPLAPALLDGAAPRRGWALEARVYAEDPDNGYLPSAGALLAWRAPAGVRVDAGVGEGSVVGFHYDPLLAKVIAWGEDREQARMRLVAALEQLVILGVANNRAWLIRALSHPAFVAGELHTRFLDLYQADLAPVSDPGRDQDILAAAVAHGWLARQRARRPAIPAGWSNNPLRDPRISFVWEGETRAVSYREIAGDQLLIDGARVTVLDAAPPALLERDGLARALPVVEDGDLLWVHHPRATACLRVLPELPEPCADQTGASLLCLAPMPGKVVSVAVVVGDAVAQGSVLVVIEAMKMEQTLTARIAGRVAAVRAAVGDQVDAGALLVALEEIPDGG